MRQQVWARGMAGHVVLQIGIARRGTISCAVSSINISVGQNGAIICIDSDSSRRRDPREIREARQGRDRRKKVGTEIAIHYVPLAIIGPRRQH
jgi:hypothetical protein